MMRRGMVRVYPRAMVTLGLLLGAAACGSSPPTAPVVTLAISSISPAQVSTAGGATVTVQGVGFAGDSTVLIDGVLVTGITVSGTTSITVVVPAHAAGATGLLVTSGGRSAASTLTYVAPSGANAPPVISSLRTVGSRANQPNAFADLGEMVDLVATVTDADTPLSALTFTWTVGAGTVTGSGASVTWQLPATLALTPMAVPVTLTVTETYTENGVEQRNIATASLSTDVHDSQTEILDKGDTFLDRFSQSPYSVDEVLSDFSTTCDAGNGRSQEASDVADNRLKFEELPGYTISRVPPVTFNFGGQCVWNAFQDPRIKNADACATFEVHWYVRYKIDILDGSGAVVIPKGTLEEAIGQDFVTAVLENGQWKLCHSDFSGTTSTTPPNGVTTIRHIRH